MQDATFSRMYQICEICLHLGYWRREQRVGPKIRSLQEGREEGKIRSKPSDRVFPISTPPLPPFVKKKSFPKKIKTNLFQNPTFVLSSWTRVDLVSVEENPVSIFRTFPAKPSNLNNRHGCTKETGKFQPIPFFPELFSWAPFLDFNSCSDHVA